MAGGLLNLIAYGNQNVIIHGDPQKTFFKVTYAKHTNFGLQKFRIDYSGLRYLQPTTETKLSFKIPRYGDLLMDTYLVLNLPDIWSPIWEPSSQTNYQYQKHGTGFHHCDSTRLTSSILLYNSYKVGLVSVNLNYDYVGRK